jgi:hypothetical protein
VGRTLVLLSRPGCGLCREMHALVDRLRGEFSLELVERNIEDDPELLRRYKLEIPVLLLGDAELARHRVALADLRARLRELLV